MVVSHLSTVRDVSVLASDFRDVDAILAGVDTETPACLVAGCILHFFPEDRRSQLFMDLSLNLKGVVAQQLIPTPDGKARCDMPGLGLPDYVPPYESVRSAPELARRFPLAMISPPARNFLNSTFVNVKSLRAIEHEPILEIAADDAGARGIADGDTVRVFNDRGDYRCVARISERADSTK